MDFWSSVLANLLADAVIAVVLGLIASRYFQAKESRQDIQKKHNDILILIKTELETNVELSHGAIKSLRENKGVPVPGLKTEIWDMFSHSGKLDWLSDDLNLLHRLSNGYNSIRGIVNWEKAFVQTRISYSKDGNQKMVELLTENMIAGYEQLIERTTAFLLEERMKQVESLKSRGT